MRVSRRGSTSESVLGSTVTEVEPQLPNQRRQSQRSPSPIARIAIQGPAKGHQALAHGDAGVRAQTPVQSKRRGSSSVAMSMMESPALFGFKQEDLDSLEDFQALDLGDLNESINAGTM